MCEDIKRRPTRKICEILQNLTIFFKLADGKINGDI